MIKGKHTVTIEQAKTSDGMNYISSVLNNNGLAIFPSDTTYACVVNATSSIAIEKLISFKARPTGKAISVFIPELTSAEQYVTMSKDQRETLAALLPGPYTVILPSKHTLPQTLEAEDGTLGLRIPQYGWINDFLLSYKKPITATSANLAGKSPHYSVAALLNSLSQRKRNMIDVIVDAGNLPHNKPSTVIDISRGNLEIMRQGDSHVDTVYVSHTPNETQDIAAKIFDTCKKSLSSKPVVILLYGDLGTGKTEFAKGIGKILMTAPIISPTFVIYYEYKVKNALVDAFYHFDLYRLKDAEELNQLGLNDILIPRNLICIEWSEKSETIMQKLKEHANIIKVHIKDEGGDTRSFAIEHMNI